MSSDRSRSHLDQMRQDTKAVEESIPKWEFDERYNEIAAEMQDPRLPEWKRDSLRAELRNMFRVAGYSDDLVYQSGRYVPRGGTEPAAADGGVTPGASALSAGAAKK